MKTTTHQSIRTFFLLWTAALVGFTQGDRFVQLNGSFNARSEANFRGSSNVAFTIPRGTQTEVLESQQFSPPGNRGLSNYGLKVRIASAGQHQGREVWIYYNARNPEATPLSFYKERPSEWSASRTPTSQPEAGGGAVTEATTPARPLGPLLADDGSTTADVSTVPCFNCTPNSVVETAQSVLAATQLSAAANASLAGRSIQGPEVSCNSRNNYLEAGLRANPLRELLSSATQNFSIVEPACTQHFMNNVFGAQSAAFRQCGGQQAAAPRSPVVRACLSNNYMNMTHDSLNVAFGCAKDHLGVARDDMKYVFGLFAAESGLHLNAMSPTGAGGFGQLTQVAIRALNTGSRRQSSPIDQLAASLRGTSINASSNQVCSELANTVLNTKMDDRPSRSCDRVGLNKQNPMKNLLYSLAYVKNSMNFIQNVIQRNRALQNKLPDNPELRNSLLSRLAVWAHNTGPAGLTTPMTALLRNSRKLQSENDINTFLSQLSQRMANPATAHSANRRGNRLRETSRYFSGIQGQLNRAEQAAGKSCIRNENEQRTLMSSN